MKCFVKIPTVHPTNVEADTTYFLNIDHIREISVATTNDRRLRYDMRAIVFRIDGTGIGTSLTAQEVINAIHEAEKEFPSVE